MSLNFVFIGAGNLATQLSTNLKKNGFTISQVYSRSENSAKILAEKLETSYCTNPKNITSEADIYFVALKDSAFDQVLPYFGFDNKLIVHCSGSLPLSILEKHSANVGVLYPLQTFSKHREVNFHDIPVFVEANTPENENKLWQLASVLSGTVTLLNSDKRRVLHIAAVFACNFVNHLYTISSEILKSKEIHFNVLKPLILETAQKVQDMYPEKAQTGPAVRFDENIIFNHLKELQNFPEYQELYNSISKSIFEHHEKLK